MIEVWRMKSPDYEGLPIKIVAHHPMLQVSEGRVGICRIEVAPRFLEERERVR